MSERRRFSGIYPILYAFFDADGALDRAAMRLQVETCLKAGAQGIVVLGIVTEVNKLDVNERRRIVDWVGEDVAGRVPYAVTCVEPSIPGQIAFAKAAKNAGADWVILQPPPAKGASEADIVRFFGTIADNCDLPVAIQNNPVNLDISLSNDGLIALGRNHENIAILKAEGPAESVARLIDATGDRFDLFSGRGGLELMTTLHSGCQGCIPAPDIFDVHLEILRLFRMGTPEAVAEADRLYKEVLPVIVFFSQTVGATLAYGKYVTAKRMGLDNAVLRAPGMKTTPFGIAAVERMIEGLGRFGELGGRFKPRL